MLKDFAIEKIAEDFYSSVLTAPKRRRRLRSSTFWNKFGFERRTKERVELVKNTLREKSIILNEDFELGSERKKDWIVLTYVENDYLPIFENVVTEPQSSEITFPSNEWFDLMKNRIFKSEREVEYFFILPLLEKLGYEESDLAIGCSIRKSIGSKAFNIEPDVVLYNGENHSKDNALLLFEAKKSKRNLTKDDVGQAEDYANVLYPPYYVLTNGDDVRVFLRRAKSPSVELITFKQKDLKENWSKIYKILSKGEVIKHKEKVERIENLLISNKL